MSGQDLYIKWVKRLCHITGAQMSISCPHVKYIKTINYSICLETFERLPVPNVGIEVYNLCELRDCFEVNVL